MSDAEQEAQPYTLEALAADLRTCFAAGDTADARRAACGHVARALKDAAFIDTHLPTRAANAAPREVLYEDPTLGFCICGHVHDGPAHGDPHDHGPSWAIYGQARGVTEMTDWAITTPAHGDEPALVTPLRTYVMEPGDAHLYDVGAVHSPKRDAPVKLIRVEGRNLDHVARSPIAAAPDAV
ncbi:MAG: hypothetical protein AAFR04_06720 [Pseudomonadota bacterium]